MPSSRGRRPGCSRWSCWPRRHRGGYGAGCATGGPLSWLRSATTGGHARPGRARPDTPGHGERRRRRHASSPTATGSGCTGPRSARASTTSTPTESAEEAATVDGGTYLHDPLWSGVLEHSLITVHPLGGCVMADRARTGVVDHRGRVFAGSTGDGVHDGLVVWDGSDRGATARGQPAAHHLGADRTGSGGDGGRPRLDDRRHSRSRARRAERGCGSRPVQRRACASPNGWPGHWSSTDTPDAQDSAQYLRAAAAGEAGGSTLSFELTIASDDLRSGLQDLSRPMRVTGAVEAPGSPTSRSWSTTARSSCSWRTTLCAPTWATCGTSSRCRPSTIGVSTSPDSKWSRRVDPSTCGPRRPPCSSRCTTTARRGRSPAAAILHISREDFARQLRTIQVTGPTRRFERLALEAGFGKAFAGRLFHTYGSVVHRSTPFNRNAPPRRRRQLDLPAPPRGRVPDRRRGCAPPDALPGRYSRPGSARSRHGGQPADFHARHRSSPNMVEYLVHAGFDVWLQEWRGSTLLPTALTQFNADVVARHDHPAAQAAVRDHTGRSELHVVAHCVGSITWMMSTLAGTTDPTSLVCSSVGLHPVGPPMTKLKAGLRLAPRCSVLGVGMLTTDSFTDESRRCSPRRPGSARLSDSESSSGATRRCAVDLAFIYGIGVHHRNVNELTHSDLARAVRAHRHDDDGPPFEHGPRPRSDQCRRHGRLPRPSRAAPAPDHLACRGARTSSGRPSRPKRTFSLLSDASAGTSSGGRSSTITAIRTCSWAPRHHVTSSPPSSTISTGSTRKTAQTPRRAQHTAGSAFRSGASVGIPGPSSQMAAASSAIPDGLQVPQRAHNRAVAKRLLPRPRRRPVHRSRECRSPRRSWTRSGSRASTK